MSTETTDKGADRVGAMPAPGSWEALGGTAVRTRRDPETGAGGLRIAFLYGADATPDRAEREVHARLIAAAPDLFAALAELTDIVRGLLEDDAVQPGRIDWFTLQPARAALAAASPSPELRPSEDQR